MNIHSFFWYCILSFAFILLVFIQIFYIHFAYTVPRCAHLYLIVGHCHFICSSSCHCHIRCRARIMPSPAAIVVESFAPFSIIFCTFDDLFIRSFAHSSRCIFCIFHSLNLLHLAPHVFTFCPLHTHAHLVFIVADIRRCSSFSFCHSMPIVHSFFCCRRTSWAPSFLLCPHLSLPYIPFVLPHLVISSPRTPHHFIVAVFAFHLPLICIASSSFCPPHHSLLPLSCVRSSRTFLRTSLHSRPPFTFCRTARVLVGGILPHGYILHSTFIYVLFGNAAGDRRCITGILFFSISS